MRSGSSIGRALALVAALTFGGAGLTACESGGGDGAGKAEEPSRAPLRVTVAAAYYTTSPAQSRPPDGVVEAGTTVYHLEDAGSYTRVVLPNGVEAYVPTSVLEPAG